MVEGPLHTLRAVTLITISTGLLALSGTACVEVDGGAAELSWYLHTFEGVKNECELAGIDTVRLCWRSAETDAGTPVALAQDCIPEQSEDFSCSANRGVTDFTILGGWQLFWVVPVCANGAVPARGTYEVPPPLLRKVEPGSVITLKSQLIVAHKKQDGMACSDTCPCVPESGGGI
jgi:hypothetical protein